MPLAASARLAAVAALVAVAVPAHAASTPDDQARFLAGLPVAAGSPLAELQKTAHWQSFQKLMDADWETLQARLLKIDAWQAAELRTRVKPDMPLLYLFGGPDAITPLRLYPDAPAYLLAGLEPVGRVPPPEALKPAALQHALDSLGQAIRTIVPSSFFRTSEMGRDLNGDAIDGVQPIVYLFLARDGAKVLGADRFEILDDGSTRPVLDGGKWTPGLAQAVTVKFQREGHAVQALTYVRVDLYNDKLAGHPGFLKYVKKLGPANAMLKAASFILHDNHFSKTRSLLLESAVSILQDDSGVPFHYLEKDHWECTTFGTYLVPLEPFQKAYQKDLAKVFEEQPKRAVPFVYGYRHGEGETSLLLAVKRPPAAKAPAPAPATPAPAVVPAAASAPK